MELLKGERVVDDSWEGKGSAAVPLCHYFPGLITSLAVR